ncbi:MAG: glycine zipper 2TM domain-containing protein [Rhodocyclaceae bacterium]|nr:glycine zipper 2TM domain-containing protein [Rhodocyclaceae bacterium]
MRITPYTHAARVTALLAASTMLLAGCQTMGSSMGGSSYSTRQVRTEQTVRLGTVESVREVQIQSDDAAVGTVAGAVIGGAAGSAVGGGRGSLITGVIGAVAGGVAGNLAEKNLRGTRGLEITVRLRNGDLIAITQAYEPGDDFRAGDPVRILSGGGVTRVTR